MCLWIFEDQILHDFVEFQKNLRLEELECSKIHYTELENLIQKVYKYIVFSFISLQLTGLIFTQIFMVGHISYIVGIAKNMLDILIYLLAIRLYFYYNVSKLYTMFHKHRLAFK